MRYGLILRAGEWSRNKYPGLKPGEPITRCEHKHKSARAAEWCRNNNEHDSEFREHAKVEVIEGEPGMMKNADI